MTYAIADGVTGSDGQNYISNTNGNINNNPTTDGGVHWTLITPLSIQATDGFGRTQLFGSSTIKAPALSQFISVTDAPWGAVGNATQVSDAAISASVNTTQLSSATAGFTSANVGQSVEVVGAGAAGKNLFGTINSVSTGIAVLSVAASTTVSGALATFGADDTTAFANAQAAVSALAALSPNGLGTLLAPASRNYMMSQAKMKSGVAIQATGATFYLINKGANNSGFSAQHVSGDAAVVNWGITGATFVGDGVSNAGVQVPVWCDVVGSSDIRVEGCQFFNLGDAAIVLYVARCWVNRNYLNGIVLTGGRNAINAEINDNVFGQASDAQIDNNVITNVGTHAIHLGTNGGISGNISSMRVSITANKVFGSVGVGITCEIGDDGFGFGVANVVVANNVIDTSGAGIAFGASSTNESKDARLAITGNIVNLVGISQAGQSGITVAGNDVTVTGNTVSVGGLATAHGIVANTVNQTVTATLDGTTNVLTSVSIPSAGQTQPVNGNFVTGTGITTGTYLVSGAGTATWTLSQNTTAPGTVTVTAQVPSQNLMIANNVIHMPSTTAGNGLNFSAMAYCTVADNNVYYDAGSASTGTFCMSILNSFYCSFVNNRLTNSPKNGILAQQTHDCDFMLNKIHNSNQNGAAAAAISITNSTNVDLDFNRIWDDQTISTLTQAILPGTCTGLRARGNRVIGATNATPLGPVVNYAEITGNILPAGAGIASTTAESYPGTTVFFTNPHPFPIKLFIAGGTITQISILTKNSTGSAVLTGQTTGVFDLGIGDQIKCTSSGNPTTFSSAPA